MAAPEVETKLSIPGLLSPLDTARPGTPLLLGTESFPSRTDYPTPPGYEFKKLIHDGHLQGGAVVFTAENNSGVEWLVKFWSRETISKVEEITGTNLDKPSIAFRDALVQRLNSSPYIVRLSESKVTDAGVYLIFEYLPARSLNDYTCDNFNSLVEERDLGKFMTNVSRAMEALIHCAEGIAHAHVHGVFHRDLKPTNMLIQEAPLSDYEDDVSVVGKVTDFEIASIVSNKLDDPMTLAMIRFEEAMKQKGLTFHGHCCYAAPEQFDIHGKISQATDVYGLAATLYFIASGVHPGTDPNSQRHPRVITAPYDAPSLARPYELRANKPGMSILRQVLDQNFTGYGTYRSRTFREVLSDIDKLFKQCTNKDQTLRLQSAKKFRDSLRKIVGA